jgi:hypothetical protein
LENDGMRETARLYFETTVAVATMAVLGIISGFVAFAGTGERMLAFLAAAAVFVLTGVVLAARNWHLSRLPEPPANPPA